MQDEFIYIIAFAVGFNFLFDKLKSFSCTADKYMTQYLLLRHWFYFLPVFFITVVFTNNNYILKDVPDFQRYYKLLLITLCVYLLFLCMVRCNIWFLFVFSVLSMIAYCIYSESTYVKIQIKNRNENDETDETFLKWLRATFRTLIVISLLILVVGVVVYIGKQSQDHNGEWSWVRFWLGVEKCAGDKGNNKDYTVLQNLKYGLLRIVGVSPKK